MYIHIVWNEHILRKLKLIQAMFNLTKYINIAGNICTIKKGLQFTKGLNTTLYFKF